MGRFNQPQLYGYKYQNQSDKGKKRWCKVHPMSVWGINPKTERFYSRCAKGFKLNEECEIGE